MKLVRDISWFFWLDSLVLFQIGSYKRPWRCSLYSWWYLPPAHTCWINLSLSDYSDESNQNFTPVLKETVLHSWTGTISTIKNTKPNQTDGPSVYFDTWEWLWKSNGNESLIEVWKYFSYFKTFTPFAPLNERVSCRWELEVLVLFFTGDVSHRYTH